MVRQTKQRKRRVAPSDSVLRSGSTDAVEPLGGYVETARSLKQADRDVATYETPWLQIRGLHRTYMLLIVLGVHRVFYQ